MTWQVIGLRQKVQRDMLAGGLPENLHREFHALSEWAWTLRSKFGDQVIVRLIDAASIEGFVKSLLRWVRRYPAFIVEGQRIPGADFAQVDAAIAGRLAASA